MSVASVLTGMVLGHMYFPLAVLLCHRYLFNRVTSIYGDLLSVMVGGVLAIVLAITTGLELLWAFPAFFAT